MSKIKRIYDFDALVKRNRRSVFAVFLVAVSVLAVGMQGASMAGLPSVRAINTPPGILAGNPDCVSWGENRVDCFDLGDGGVVYHSWWDGPGTAWSSWVTLGAVLSSTPSCVTYPILFGQRIDCVGARADGVAFHTAWDGNSWSSWENPSGFPSLAGPPTCVQATWDASGDTENFVCAALISDDTFDSWALNTRVSPTRYYALWDSSGLNPHPSPAFSTIAPPSCVSWGSDRLDCFDVKQDATPYHITVEPFVGGFSGNAVESLTPGALLFPPSCVSLKSNDLDCIGVGTDNQPYHDGWNGATWSGWTPLGGALRDPPSCVTWGGNHIECIGVGTDNQAYRSYSDDYGISWSSWDLTAPGPLANAAFPSCVSWGAGRIDCVGIGTDDQAYHLALDANSHSWSSWELIGCGAINCNPTPPSSTSTESPLTILYNSNFLPLTKTSTSTTPIQTFVSNVFASTTSSTTAGGATSPPPATTTGTIATTQTQVQTTAPSTTQTSQSSSATQPTIVTQTQTITQGSSSQTAPPTSSQQTQLASQPDVLSMLQQNSLLVMAALGALLVAVIALKRRGGKHTSPSPASVGSKSGAASLFCGQCGASNPSTSEYCGKCGHALKAA